jgi:hypothetical protein
LFEKEYGDYEYPSQAGSGGGGCAASDIGGLQTETVINQMERKCGGGAAFALHTTSDIIINGTIDMRGGDADTENSYFGTGH